jgi:DNA-binding GntR family transcriptional regulator
MEPRSAALARRIAQDIADGQHPVGSLLPGELELAAHHGVSRGTIRMAMRQLQDMGLISRRKRAGTRVEASQPPASYAQSLGTIEDLVQYAAAAKREVRSIDEVVADDELAARLGCKPGQRWVRLITTRRDPQQPGRPISWTTVYLDPAYGGAVRRQVHQSTALIATIIGQAYGTYVAEIRQEIRALGVPAALAPCLGCEPGAPALEITRHYRDHAGRVFEITISIQPGDRFGYVSHLRRVGNRTLS